MLTRPHRHSVVDKMSMLVARYRTAVIAALLLVGVGATVHPLMRSALPDVGIMAGTTRAPLVLVSGQIAQLPSGDLIGASGITTTSTTTANTFANGPAGINGYGGVHFDILDEHLDGTRASTGVYNSFQVVTLTGGATQYAADSNAWGTRMGVQVVGTGTATTGSVTEIGNVNQLNFGQLSNALYEDVVLFPTLSTATDEYSFIAGFWDTTSALNQVDGCWIQYDRGNVATGGPNTSNLNNWECWCSNNSVRTACVMDGTSSCGGQTTVAQPVAAGSAPNTNWYHLKVVEVSTSEIDFYVNGTKSCQITSNIPTASGRGFGAGHAWRKSAGTTSLFYDIDFTHLAYDLNSPRTP